MGEAGPEHLTAAGVAWDAGLATRGGRRAWTAATVTSRAAPCDSATRAAASMVAPVLTMSSAISRGRPVTSPTSSVACTSVPLTRVLRTTATGPPRAPATRSARRTAPRSGVTTTASSGTVPARAETRTGSAVSISTGTANIDSSAGVCGSTTSSRWAPAAVSTSATDRAPTASPSQLRRSCRA